MTISDVIRQNKGYYLIKFAKNYENPNTDYNTIFNNILIDFENYAEDEASIGEYGTLSQAFYNGYYSDVDIDNEFDDFTNCVDLEDYDFYSTPEEI